MQSYKPNPAQARKQQLGETEVFSSEDHHELYEAFKCPPILQIAETHYDCTSIGYEIEEDDLEDHYHHNQDHIANNPDHHHPEGQFHKPKQCPCCYAKEKEPIGFWDKCSQLVEHGLALPLYFRFKDLAYLTYLLLIAGSVYPCTQLFKIFRAYLIENGLEFAYGLSLFTEYNSAFLSEVRAQIENLENQCLWLDIVCNLLLIALCVYLKVRGSWFVHEDQEKTRVDPRDFTLMIGNVKQDDSEEDIRAFLKEITQCRGLRNVKIVKISKVGPKSRVDFVENLIKETETELKSMQKYYNGVRGLLSTAQKDIANESILVKRRRVEALGRALERARKAVEGDLGRELNLDNCLAFVTFSTIKEKEEVLNASLPVRCWIRRAFGSRKGYKVMNAPILEDIRWDCVGYKLGQRKLVSFSVASINTAQLLILLFLTSGYIFEKNSIFPKNPKKSTTSHPWGNTFSVITLVILLNAVWELFYWTTDRASTMNRSLTKTRIIVKNISIKLIAKLSALILSVYLSTTSGSTKIGNFLDPDVSVELTKYIYGFCFFDLAWIIASHIFDVKAIRIKRRMNSVRDGLVMDKFSNRYHFRTQRDLQQVFERPEFPLERSFLQIMGPLVLIILGYFYSRLAPVLGIIFMGLYRVSERRRMMTEYRPPQPQMSVISQKMLFSACFLLPRLFTVCRSVYVFSLKDFNSRTTPTFKVINYLVIFMIFLPYEWLLNVMLNVKQRLRVNLTAQSRAVNFESVGANTTGRTDGTTRMSEIGATPVAPANPNGLGEDTESSIEPEHTGFLVHDSKVENEVLGDSYRRIEYVRGRNEENDSSQSSGSSSGGSSESYEEDEFSKRRMRFVRFLEIEHLFRTDYDRDNPSTFRGAWDMYNQRVSRIWGDIINSA